MHKRNSSFLLPFLFVASAIVAPTAAFAEKKDETPAIVPIVKAIPADIKTFNAPDKDPLHYQTLDGTHFSYRCYDPYTMKSNQAAVEVCEIDPVKLQLLGWPETEVIHLIHGQVTITDNNGVAKSYSAGDIFVMPEGFKGIWQQSQKLLKVVVRHPLFWKD